MKIIKRKIVLITKCLNKKFYRFLLVGFINTMTSYIIYSLCLLLMNYMYSYFLSLLICLFLSSYLNVKFVFKIKSKRLTILPFFVIFISQGLIGAKLLQYWVESLFIPEIIAPLLNIIFLTPLVFSLSSFISKYFFYKSWFNIVIFF